LDQKIAAANDCGETTGVIAIVSANEIFGANVGDSAAWLFTPDGKEELSRVRKPYLGTGVDRPPAQGYPPIPPTRVMGDRTRAAKTIASHATKWRRRQRTRWITLLQARRLAGSTACKECDA